MEINVNSFIADQSKLTDKQKNYLKEADENMMLARAFARANQKATQKKTSKKTFKKKLGRVSVSNTDTVIKCLKIKSQLNAKLKEITGSTIDDKVKQALVRDVMMQINKVEVKITEIKRREAAVIAEKKAKQNELEHVRRKRRADMRKRTDSIRRDYLYPASEGGFDPADPLGISSTGGDTYSSAEAALFVGTGAGAAVTADIGGGEISMSDADVGAAVANASVEVMV